MLFCAIAVYFKDVLECKQSLDYYNFFLENFDEENPNEDFLDKLIEHVENLKSGNIKEIEIREKEDIYLELNM